MIILITIIPKLLMKSYAYWEWEQTKIRLLNIYAIVITFIFIRNKICYYVTKQKNNTTYKTINHGRRVINR